MNIVEVSKARAGLTQNLSEGQARVLRETVFENRYIPHTPTIKQAEMLTDPSEEILYGGAAGGAKSWGMLMAALQYTDEPDYAALVLRRTYSQLSQPGGLIPTSKEWLMNSDAQWRETQYQWTFPSGAVLKFGHMADINDMHNYQGAQYQFVGFDELTQFTESQYTYLFSRRRRETGSEIPTRFVSTSNPGGVGHDWVKRRFILPHDSQRVFIPSRLADNPYLDQENYRRALAELDPVTRRQLEEGDWDVAIQGNFFKRGDFTIIDKLPHLKFTRVVRYWDCASTEASGSNDPDYTVGLKMASDHMGNHYVLDVIRVRSRPSDVLALQIQTARVDGAHVEIAEEEEGGSSGKAVIEHKIREFGGYSYRGVRSTGSKFDRAKPVASKVAEGIVKFINGYWLGDFMNECVAFSDNPKEYGHDDQVDVLSGAYNYLNSGGDASRFDNVSYGRYGR